MPGIQKNNTTTFLRIVGGNLAQKVDPTTPQAEKRTYQPPNGEIKENWEKIYYA